MIIGLGKFSLKPKKKKSVAGNCETLDQHVQTSNRRSNSSGKNAQEHGTGNHMIPTRTRYQNTNDELCLHSFPGAQSSWEAIFS